MKLTDMEDKLKKHLDFCKKYPDTIVGYEHGIINEHYVVRCLLQVPDTSIPINNMLGKKEKICLVSVSEFNSWLKGEDSIKWV